MTFYSSKLTSPYTWLPVAYITSAQSSPPIHLLPYDIQNGNFFMLLHILLPYSIRSLLSCHLLTETFLDYSGPNSTSHYSYFHQLFFKGLFYDFYVPVLFQLNTTHITRWQDRALLNVVPFHKGINATHLAWEIQQVE